MASLLATASTAVRSGAAVADYAVVKPEAGLLLHTPEGVSDLVASTLWIAGRSADAALKAIGVQAGDTVLVGGAAGGVGVFAVQLARLALGVAPERISTIAAGPNPPGNVRATGGRDAAEDALDRVTDAIIAASSLCRSPRPSRSSRSARP